MTDVLWRGKNRKKSREEKAIDGEISFLEYAKTANSENHDSRA